MGDTSMRKWIARARRKEQTGQAVWFWTLRRVALHLRLRERKRRRFDRALIEATSQAIDRHVASQRTHDALARYVLG